MALLKITFFAFASGLLLAAGDDAVCGAACLAEALAAEARQDESLELRQLRAVQQHQNDDLLAQGIAASDMDLHKPLILASRANSTQFEMTKEEAEAAQLPVMQCGIIYCAATPGIGSHCCKTEVPGSRYMGICCTGATKCVHLAGGTAICWYPGSGIIDPCPDKASC
jgi:hypothetical protein